MPVSKVPTAQPSPHKNPALTAISYALYALALAAVVVGVLYVAREFIGAHTGLTSSEPSPRSIDLICIEAYRPSGGGSGHTVNRFLTSVVAWLRAGYPEGIPPTDYFPVLALLSRRLSNDEVKVVARELMQRGDFDHVDIGVLITQLTDELPVPEDVERVRERLAAKGWPLDDARDGEETG